ncbi:MAG: rod shape-determining protein MreC [Bacteriovoracaceae bacterium]
MLNSLNYQKKRLKLVLNVSFLLFALISFSSKKDVLQKTTLFETVMMETFVPIQRGISSVQFSIKSLINSYIANVNASKENVGLVKKVQELENEIFKLSEVSLENDRLKSLLEFRKKIPYETVTAQVVARDSHSDYKVFRVNKGYSHGIRLQSVVVTGKGLVGYVYRLTDHFSDIITIVDPEIKIDGMVQRIRSHGMLEGNAKSKMNMKYIPKNDRVILYDQIVTSGLGNIFPKGLLVGRVTKIEKEHFGITQRIEVTPVVDLDKLEEVLVLVSDIDPVKQAEWDVLDKQSGAEVN